MVVRLGFPTRPSALRSLMNNKNIEIKYYTDSSFHPKVYIFGEQIALVGSANLTQAALQTNQEIVVSINSKDPKFRELKLLFTEYWDGAKILSNNDLNAYEEVFDSYKKAIEKLKNMDKEIRSKVGNISFTNIKNGDNKLRGQDLDYHLEKASKSTRDLFIELHKRILNLNNSVEFHATKKYIAHKTTRNFTEIHFRKRKNLLDIHLLHANYYDPKKLLKVVPSTHDWVLNSKVDLSKLSDIEDVFKLVEQSFIKSRKT